MYFFWNVEIMNMLICFNMKNRLTDIIIEFRKCSQIFPLFVFQNFFYLLSRKNIDSWTLKLESMSMIKTLSQFEKQDWKLIKISQVQLQEQNCFEKYWEIHLWKPLGNSFRIGFCSKLKWTIRKIKILGYSRLQWYILIALLHAVST